MALSSTKAEAHVELRDYLLNTCKIGDWVTQDVLTRAARGPDAAVSAFWEGLGGSALSIFGVAGISDTPPQGVLRRLKANPNPGLSLGFCVTTYLPVLFRSFNGYSKPFEDRHQDDLEEHFRESMEEAGDFCCRNCGEVFDEDGFEKAVAAACEPYNLRRMLRLYGGTDWRKHCTKDFNPFERRETKAISQATWDHMRGVWHLAAELGR